MRGGRSVDAGIWVLRDCDMCRFCSHGRGTSSGRRTSGVIISACCSTVGVCTMRRGRAGR